MEQSVHLASLVQKQFRHTCKRVDRGVHQAGFLVLKASAMPSILVELGFISTPEEERYLNSEAGANTMAKGIYHAFLNYKREQEIRLTGASKTIIPTEEPATSAPEQRELMAEASTTPATATKTAPKRPIVSESATNDSEITFKIQILTSSKPLTKNDKRLKGLRMWIITKKKDCTNIRMALPVITIKYYAPSVPSRHNSKTHSSSPSETAKR